MAFLQTPLIDMKVVDVMEPIAFFDCNCSIGMRGILNSGSFYKVEDLITKMKYYGIVKALTYHSMAREYSPAFGNNLLMDEIKDYPFLYPVWVVMHHHTAEFPEPKKLARQLKENNIRAVRMFPAVSDQNYSISEWNCGELLSMLEKSRIPLMLGFDQLTWNELHELCREHPELNVILTGVNYRIDRNLYALFEKFDNLFV
ncbi:MAG: hypothetical protein Q7J78_01075, partial [Clostridiales bacterium]|nr:hypothetical protein [Clostridiales bacterium]